MSGAKHGKQILFTYFLHLMRCLNCWDNKKFWGAKSGQVCQRPTVNNAYYAAFIHAFLDQIWIPIWHHKGAKLKSMLISDCFFLKIRLIYGVPIVFLKYYNINYIWIYLTFLFDWANIITLNINKYNTLLKYLLNSSKSNT